MRLGMGLAFLVLGLSGVANAQVEPSQIVGAWVCDQTSDADHLGVDMQIEYKLAFSADGTFAHGVVLAGSGNVPASGPRTVTAHMSLKGTWKLEGHNENGTLLLFDNVEAKLTDVLLNGHRVDPAPYQQVFIEMIGGERGGMASVVGDQLKLDYGGPMLCSRQAPADAI